MSNAAVERDLTDKQPATRGQSSDELIAVRRATKSYRSRDARTVPAVAEVDLNVGHGEFVSIVGPSGCGKTTLLKMLAGLVKCTSGDILYRGNVVSEPPDGIGLVFQSPVLLPWLDVLGNVVLPARILKLDRRAAETRAAELLTLVGLAGFEKNYPGELSGGMQQRAAIVRSLIHDPSVLLMDEPFAALDALTRERLAMELQVLWMQTKKSVVFVTHSIAEAVFLSDRVIVMSARPGRILADIAISAARPRQHDVVEQVLHGQVTEIRGLLEEAA